MKAKTIQFSGKTADLCHAVLYDAQGNELGDRRGYVPDLGFGDGDYVEFTLDLETGKIVGWKPPTEEALADAFNIEPS